MQDNNNHTPALAGTAPTLEKRDHNYARFYRQIALHDEGVMTREELKDCLVLQYTGGCTSHVREMTAREYETACRSLEYESGERDKLRRQRSVCLRLMTRLGVDTTDWAQVDDFCRHPRVAGRPFRRLFLKDLEQLAIRLRCMQRKGWCRREAEERAAGRTRPAAPCGPR